jgi:hypothetical protein
VGGSATSSSLLPPVDDFSASSGSSSPFWSSSASLSLLVRSRVGSGGREAGGRETREQDARGVGSDR